jgi:deoxyadenosine/deoxycytidine kinase
MSSLPPPIVIFFDGLPGAGKSTIVNTIAFSTPPEDSQGVKPTTRYSGDRFVKFEEYIHEPMLDAMIGDIERYGFTYQVMMIQRRIITLHLILKEIENGNNVVSDRSVVGDSSFAHNLQEEKIITANEWIIYQGMMREAVDLYKKVEESGAVLKHIYLDVEPKEAYKRICDRNRSSESSYTLKYLSGLEKSHSAMYKKLNIEPICLEWIHQTPKMDSDGERFDCGPVFNALRLVEV